MNYMYKEGSSDITLSYICLKLGSAHHFARVPTLSCNSGSIFALTTIMNS